MSISYDYYRIFYTAAQYGSFTRAAEILQSSQPNVTRSIRYLEHELGCSLFLRSRQGVALTPEGEKLFAHVRIACDHLQAAENELSKDQKLESGSVFIGASETALHGLLLPVLGEYHRAYPYIQLHIANHTVGQAVSAVRSGLVDFAVTVSPNGVQNPLHEETLIHYEEILIAGSGFSHLRQKELTLEEVSEYPLVSVEQHSITYEFYKDYFAGRHLSYHPQIEVATMGQILPMVKYGLGIGFLPDFMFEDSLAARNLLCRSCPLTQAHFIGPCRKADRNHGNLECEAQVHSANPCPEADRIHGNLKAEAQLCSAASCSEESDPQQKLDFPCFSFVQKEDEVFKIRLVHGNPVRSISLIRDKNRPVGIAARRLIQMIRESAYSSD